MKLKNLSEKKQIITNLDEGDYADKYDMYKDIIKVHSKNQTQGITEDIVLAKFEEPKDKIYIMEMSYCGTLCKQIIKKIQRNYEQYQQTHQNGNIPTLTELELKLNLLALFPSHDRREVIMKCRKWETGPSVLSVVRQKNLCTWMRTLSVTGDFSGVVPVLGEREAAVNGVVRKDVDVSGEDAGSKDEVGSKDGDGVGDAESSDSGVGAKGSKESDYEVQEVGNGAISFKRGSPEEFVYVDEDIERYGRF